MGTRLSAGNIGLDSSNDTHDYCMVFSHCKTLIWHFCNYFTD
jgi:hypothetical protein